MLKILKILFEPGGLDYITSDGRARNSYQKDSTIKVCHLIVLRVEQGTHNLSKNTTHFLIFGFQCKSTITVHANGLANLSKKPTEGWHKVSNIGRYILQVAGCRLKFNYNWKTAGTWKKRTDGRLTVTVTWRCLRSLRKVASTKVLTRPKRWEERIFLWF